MGWLMGAGLIAGGAIGVLALAMPQPASLNVTAALVNGSLAFLTGAATLLLRDRTPSWTYRPLVLLGIGFVTASVPISGDAKNDTELLYVYLVLFAFYFFSWQEAFAVLGIAVVAYGVVLVDQGGGNEGATLLIFGSVLAVNGIVFRLLRERTRDLVEALRRSARTDPLTGLLNRRGLQEAVEEELAAAGRGAYSLIIADLDDFKRVNDRLGHLGGDMTLERVTALISKTKRAGDHSARLGGEEFAMALPGAGAKQATAIAERVRGAIERAFADSPVPLTCTFGIATYPEHGRTLEELMISADRALYAAKDFGKNRALVYDEALKGVLLQLAEEIPRVRVDH